MDVPGGSVVKNPPDNAGNMGSIPVSWRSPGESKDNSLQYSCLPEKSHGQRNLEGYSPWCCKGVGHDWVKKQQHICIAIYIYICVCVCMCVCVCVCVCIIFCCFLLVNLKMFLLGFSSSILILKSMWQADLAKMTLLDMLFFISTRIMKRTSRSPCLFEHAVRPACS